MPPLRSIVTPALVRALALTCFACAASSGQGSGALPPVRPLGRRVAIATDTLQNIVGVRPLRDSRVIVNDNVGRRLLLFDSTLRHPIVIADSTATTKKAYGATQGGIIAALADTTLFVDPVALSMLVIDPQGKIVRTIAPPRPKDAFSMVMGRAAVDARGRILYRVVSGTCDGGRGCMMSFASGAADTTKTDTPTYAQHDSVVILRADVVTHVVDTAGFIATPFLGLSKFSTNPDGSPHNTRTLANLIPIVDDWAVTSDGSVAFVRGLDYHVDWIDPDGRRHATPKIAHDWHRLTDSEKTAAIDSVHRAMDSSAAVQAAVVARHDSANRAAGMPVGPHGTTTYIWPQAADLPDYLPALRFGNMGGPVSIVGPLPDVGNGPVRADADDNLWIRQIPSKAEANLPPVYDIVDRRGTLIDRVRIPPSLSIAGFGPGVVYLTSREGPGMILVEYRIR
jgi:hypothetical protein